MSRGTLDPVSLLSLSITGLSPSLAGFPKTVLLVPASDPTVQTPLCSHSGLGSSPFARRYLGNRCFFLFLWVLRCFSSPGSPPYLMDSGMDDRGPPLPCSHIQISAALWTFAPPRSFSQLITSFFGSQCQGIHPAPFLA